MLLTILMFKAILDFLSPLQTIAKELRIIRKLYEADLSHRQHPIYRITHRPKKSDTQVYYTGQDADTKPKHKQWVTDMLDGVQGHDEEDE